MSQAHLRNVEEPIFIGYVPGDPTLPPLDDAIPAPNPAFAQNKVVDLRTWDAVALQVEADRFNPSDPFEPFHLPAMPGVPTEKVATFTGHDPSDYLGAQAGPGRGRGPSRPRARSTLSDEQILEVMRRTLPHPGRPIAWVDLGYRNGGLTLAGKEVQLRDLWDMVQGAGGFAAVCSTRKWTSVAIALGADTSRLTNASHVVKGWYLRFFANYEKSLQSQELPS
ncbi:hypothetical protein ACKKBG_A32805 [Auxenochlorella protothecoides x Auxenochlorella symbiontica]|uniref:ARID domain-containing protein n=2 Tax=Auxenochlorella protothecoides TaxID=3075 RepID=A0A1D1ZNN1_AUXPR|nr:hypothetical protein APUTEX25_004242 [Auxenochlorella protothecoides]|eukprot:RMZ57408.1 hypothetical protein APUTEX25_004242 [Auxenochlorella protothecoides]